MKDAYYFQHDSNAHNDPKMLALRIKTGWEGVGLYWTFLEILRDMPDYKYVCGEGYLKEIELRLSTPQATLEAWLKQACEVGLLVQKDGFLYSKSFCQRMQEIDEKRAILVEAGRRGGLKSSQAKGRLKPPSSRIVKDSKGKDRIEEPTTEIGGLILKNSFLKTLKDTYSMLNVESEILACITWHKNKNSKVKKWDRAITNWVKISYEKLGVIGGNPEIKQTRRQV